MHIFLSVLLLDPRAKVTKKMSAGDWCLIESDPGVFTELIKGFGVQGVQVEELWSLDDDSFEQLKPIHGLIFLYKWKPGEEPQGSIVQDSRLRDIYFAKQVINNACATQAIISVLLNISHTDMDLGSVLADFRDFSRAFDASTRGLTLSNSEQIRKVHNSFSRQEMFEFDKELQKKDDDVYHFVAYVPIKGRLYELDGLKEGPVDLGKCDEGDWLKSVKPVLDKRMQSYAADEIHFNLMAVVSDRKRELSRKCVGLDKRRDLAALRIQSIMEGVEVMDEGPGGLPSDLEQLAAIIEDTESKIAQCKVQLAQENTKMERYQLENIRRKHNYLPLIMEVLKILAKRGELVKLCEQAKTKKAEQRENKEKTAKA
ncbi:ubiquitin carboxyl-terminal hydrolase isozyme L5-like [Halichondria panicea]|uniref:ubiquitin carboxyl-terminal hydrolase isozyme L5-like n=1 Tax=Halichondria panicea TaxID=6063 RepID=UPI00312B98A9